VLSSDALSFHCSTRILAHPDSGNVRRPLEISHALCPPPLAVDPGRFYRSVEKMDRGRSPIAIADGSEMRDVFTDAHSEAVHVLVHVFDGGGRGDERSSASTSTST